jgi:diguanylate cyclase (GGDEF)-like protein
VHFSVAISTVGLPSLPLARNGTDPTSRDDSASIRESSRHTKTASLPVHHALPGATKPPPSTGKLNAPAHPPGKGASFQKAMITSLAGNATLGALVLSQMVRYNTLFNVTTTDELTGLRTKEYLKLHGNEVVRNLQKTNPDQAIYAFHMDVNGLKLVNDFVGKQYGDKLLQLVQPVVAEQSKAGEVALFRYGKSGDEFELLLAAKDQDDAIAKMTKIQKHMVNQTHDWQDIKEHLALESERLKQPFNTMRQYVQFIHHEQKKDASTLDPRFMKPLGLTVAGIQIAPAKNSSQATSDMNIDFTQVLQQLTQMEKRARTDAELKCNAFFDNHEDCTPENRHMFEPGLVMGNRQSERVKTMLNMKGIVPEINVWHNLTAPLRRLKFW